MKHNATQSSRGSGSGRDSRLGLAVLVATVAAFLLVPVAQALAAGTTPVKVNIAGSGSGEVTTTNLGPGTFEPETIHFGSPDIRCSYPPQEGQCENSVQFGEAPAFFEGKFQDLGTTQLMAYPAAGSEVGGWTIEKGKDYWDVENGEPCGTYDAEGEEQYGGPYCQITTTNQAEGIEATVAFCLEGQSLEECLPPTGPVLTVHHEGTGEGTVQSSPAGITCLSGDCSKAFAENTEVTLTASPAAGSTFTSWKKCDTGKVEGRKCTVKMSVAKTVGAKFTKTYDVTVKKTTGSTGLGSVSGVVCDTSCTAATASFLEGKTVTLKPKAYKGSEFTGWTGCPEVIETVNCKVAAAATVEAKFSEIAKFKLTVNKSGGGQGMVKTKPPTINCGLTCSTQASLFYKGTSVELTASVTAGKGSTFTGFTGGTGSASGCSTSPCIFTITANSSVTAKFE